jgi:hypothetical protein
MHGRPRLPEQPGGRRFSHADRAGQAKNHHPRAFDRKRRRRAGRSAISPPTMRRVNERGAEIGYAAI